MWHNSEHHTHTSLTLRVGRILRDRIVAIRGSWENDLFNGHGVEKWPQGSYKGTFKDGKKDGNGKIKFNNGKSYVGEFQKNQMHGQGVYNTTNYTP